MEPLNKIDFAAIAICVGFVFFYNPICHAESKSEMIKRLRNKSCVDDIRRTAAQMSQLKQLQFDISQLVQSMQNASLKTSTFKYARRVKTTLENISAALSAQNRSKQTICDRLTPDTGTTTGDYPEGHKALSKSQRIKQLKVDYCADVQQNGELVRTGIPILRASMDKIRLGQSTAASIKASFQRLQNTWSQTIPVINELYHEQVTANEICINMGKGISKSDLIEKSKQGLEKGGQISHFWYMIQYD